MHVLVTGATGFIGGHLVDLLQAERHTIRAAVRRDSPQAESLAARGVDVMMAPLGDPEALVRAASGAEIVFHLAALASYVAPYAKLRAVNVEGTRSLLEASKTAGVRRLVFASTASVVLRNQNRHGETEDVALPRTWIDGYSQTKAAAEALVLAANGEKLQTVSIRPPWVWGERDTNVLKALIRPIQRGQFFWMSDGKNQITTCHAANIAHGLLLAAQAEQAPGKAYNLADAEQPSVGDFVRSLCKACEIEPPSRRLPYPIAYTVATLCDRLRKLRIRGLPPITRPSVISLGRAWVLSDQRARTELGYRPLVSMEEGLARLEGWVEASGGINMALSRRR